MADENTSNMPANRIPLAQRMKKLTETMRVYVRKPYGEETDDVEVHEVMDGGSVVARAVKKDGDVLEFHSSPDLQESGQDEKVKKAVGIKKGESTSTTPAEVAKDTEEAEQLTPERKKEGETHEAEGEEKIKAPDSKEKKTKEPKDGKKPDNSMSKMASQESAETQGAAPLEKNYHVKRVGDTLHYTRLGEKPKKPVSPQGAAGGPQSGAGPAVPPHATQTPNQVATKAPSTGPDQPRGTAASPQQPPAPAPAGGKIAPAAPTAKQPPSTKWKEMFQARKKQRDMQTIAGGKGYVTSKGQVMVKSEPEEYENTPGNRKRAKDEYEQDMKEEARRAHEAGEPLKKDVVEFKKPKTDNKSMQVDANGKLVPNGTKQYHPGHEPKGHQAMFDVLKRGRQTKPGTRDEKIKAALAQQAEAGSPYATARNSAAHQGKTAASTPAETVKQVQSASEPKEQKPVLVRDMNRLKGHTQSGRPFRVMLATHEDHQNLPGYHMGLDKDHSIAQIRKHLSNPIHPITKAVYAALERGHDKLIVHNPTQPFKAVK